MDCRQIFSWFVIFLLINSIFPEPSFAASVLAEPKAGEEKTAATGAAKATEATAAVPAASAEKKAVVPETEVLSIQCSLEELSPQEAEVVKKLLQEGFVGNALDANSAISEELKKDRQKGDDKKLTLENNKLVLTNPDSNDAAVAEMPNQRMKPVEISHLLNTYVRSAPFAYGIVLNETLRTAKCKDPQSAECWISPGKLKLRNDGTGVVKIGGDLYREMKGWVSEKTGIGDANKLEGETAYLKGEIEATDPKQVEEIAYARLQKDMLPNSILADKFDVKLQTNCNNELCTISSYSTFDKYYNAWFSAEMVFGDFGPTLIGRTKKMFGIAGRRGLWPRLEDMGFMKSLRKSRLFRANSLISRYRNSRIQERLNKHGLGDFWNMITLNDIEHQNGAKLIKSQEFTAFWRELTKAGGYVDNIKDAQARKELLRAVNDVRKITSSMKAFRDEAFQKWKQAEATLGPDNPITRNLRIEFGKVQARNANVFDDVLDLDWQEMWSKTNPNFFMRYDSVKNVDTGKFHIMTEDHRNYKLIADKFEMDGHWGNWNPSRTLGTRFETDAAGNLIAYKPKLAGEKVGEIDWGSFEKAVAKGDFVEMATKLDDGTPMPITLQNIPIIKKKTKGNIQYYKYYYAPDRAITPYEFASDLTNGRSMYFDSDRAYGNATIMVDDLKNKGFGDFRYNSMLDKAFKEEQELIKQYFTLKGSVKWTAVPFAYWWMKRGGGIEKLSAYLLPDTWAQIEMVLGSEDEPIFSDAYIDFFANAGSDEGDLFVRILNKLPWKYVLDKVSDEFNPLREIYDKITSRQSREKVEDLAFFLTAPETCTGCVLNISAPKGFEMFRPFYMASQQMQAFLLEDTKTETDKGQLLITYSHHMNYKGKMTDAEENGDIDLTEALKNDKRPEEEEAEPKSCQKKVEELGNKYTLGGLGGILSFKGDQITGEKGGLLGGKRFGLLLAGAEAITYRYAFWGGVFATAMQQILIAPELQDCVDTEEGYYVHYFMPSKNETDKTTGQKKKSAEKTHDVVKAAKEQILDPIKRGVGQVGRETLEKVETELKKVSENPLENRIVQASLKTYGLTAAGMQAPDLFYLWCGPECDFRPAGYREEGKRKIAGVNDENVVADYEKGVLQTPYGDIEKPDLIRMDYLNNQIPAEVIPQRITKVVVPPSEELLFKVDVYGNTKVEHEQILECIRDGIEKQTGLKLNPDNAQSKNLADAFGRLDVVITNTHPVIKPESIEEKRIVANGQTKVIARGEDAAVNIKMNMDTEIAWTDKGTAKIEAVGNMRSMQFENGTIVHKPQTHELLIHLRHHKLGVVNQDDIRSLKSKLETVKNPETGCDEPAINFEALPNPESDRAKKAVDNFNKALKKQGPFQIFETETKRYVLYTDKDCKTHLKIIDKETGEVEKDIVGTVTQTPTGIKITEPDGTEHTLDFSADDGIPKVSFDGEPPETLRTAQGRNGSFYYDPTTGQWYAENGQLIPLIEAFKQAGIGTQVGKDGSVNSTATGNVLNLNIGEGKPGGLLNLPSLPENPLLLVIYILSLIVAIAFVRIRLENQAVGRRSR